MFGTGNVIYGQAGYLMKKDLFGEGNGADAICDGSKRQVRPSRQANERFDAGINWFIKGHTSKFTLDYQNRPVYDPWALPS